LRGRALPRRGQIRRAEATSAISTGAFSAFVAGTSTCGSGCGGTAMTGGGRTRIDDRVTVNVEADV